MVIDQSIVEPTMVSQSKNEINQIDQLAKFSYLLRFLGNEEKAATVLYSLHSSK